MTNFVASLEETQTETGYLYDCPETPSRAKAVNDIPEYFDYHMDNSVYAHQRGEEEDPNYYANGGFRNVKHGGHHFTFSQYKEQVRDIRASLFGDEVQDGDIIYEGAGAEGLSLLMTLEILKEERGITGLTAYGHDYFMPFVEIANKLFDAQVSVNGSWMKRGRYCQGDSTDLSFVPSNSFDLAYTYVDPLIDGLGRHNDDDYCTVRVTAIKELCMSENLNHRRIIRMDQRLQEKWHADWATELIRITKPGRLVVVENVCRPLCADKNDWGGVAPGWWKWAAEENEWDVYVGSIKIYDESVFDNCYHVAMRKRLRPYSGKDDVDLPWW